MFDKRLIIHLGQHKTGSTSIQHSLLKLGEESSTLYPKSGLRGCGHAQLADDLRRLKGFDMAALSVQGLIDEINVSDCHNVVLSSEFFSSSNEMTFNEVMTRRCLANLSTLASLYVEFEVIYYIRDQAKSIMSRIAQAIRSRVCLSEISSDYFLNYLPLNYLKFDDLLREYFPSDSLTVRLFSVNSLYGGDVCKDFSNALGIDIPVSHRTNVTNEPASLLYEMLQINKMNISTDEKMRRKASAKNAFNNHKPINDAICDNADKFMRLASEHSKSVRDKLADSNSKFLLRYPHLPQF